MPASLVDSLRETDGTPSHVFYGRRQFEETYGRPPGAPPDHILDDHMVCGAWITDPLSCLHVDEYCALPETTTCEACSKLEGCGYCSWEDDGGQQPEARTLCRPGMASGNFVFSADEQRCPSDRWTFRRWQSSRPDSSCPEACRPVWNADERGVVRVGTLGMGEEYPPGSKCPWHLTNEGPRLLEALVKPTGRHARVVLSLHPPGAEESVLQTWEDTFYTDVWSKFVEGPVQLTIEHLAPTIGDQAGVRLQWQPANEIDGSLIDRNGSQACNASCRFATVLHVVYIVVAVLFAGFILDRLIAPLVAKRRQQRIARKLTPVAIPAPGDAVCCICLDGGDTDGGWVELRCQHKFHRRCVVTWLQQTQACPMCRQTTT